MLGTTSATRRAGSVVTVVSAGDSNIDRSAAMASEWKLGQPVGEDAKGATGQDSDKAKRSHGNTGCGVKGI